MYSYVIKIYKMDSETILMMIKYYPNILYDIEFDLWCYYKDDFLYYFDNIYNPINIFYYDCKNKKFYNSEEYQDKFCVKR